MLERELQNFKRRISFDLDEIFLPSIGARFQ